MPSPDEPRQDPSAWPDTARHEAAEHAAMAAQDRAATANDRVRVERLVGALGLDTSRAPVMVAPTHSEPASADSLVAVQDNGVTRGVNILVMGNGCVHATRHGMGTSGDQTAAFRAALAEARAGGACLVLPPGDITVTAPQPIELGALRALEGQNTRVTFTGIPSGQRTLNARGQRRVVASRLRPERGTTELRLPAGLMLRPGQTLLFVSGEPTPYASIDYYGRGERNVVADYDTRSGRLILVSPLLYTYRSGQHTFASGARTVFDGVTVFAVDEHAFDLGDGLTLAGPNTDAVGAWIAMCQVTSAARFENWGNTGLSLSACTGRVEGSIFSGWYPGSGNAYGVCVGDLSRITVSADVAGGRHAVTSGGGGEFTRQEAGSSQTGGTYNTGLALPSVLHVIGGEYRATNQQPMGAIDAHGIVEELIVVGATVHEGIQASARKSRIASSTIYHQAMAGVYMSGTTGNYIPEGEALSWGDLDVCDCRIESVGAALLASVQVMQGSYTGLKLTGVRIRGRFEQNDRDDVYRTWLSVPAENTTIRRVDIEADALLEGNPRWALLRLSHRPKRIRVSGNVPLLVIAPANVSYEAEVDLDLTSSPRETYGVSLFGGQDVVLSGRIVGARWSGARIEAKRVEVSGTFENNGRDPAGRSTEDVKAALVVKADEVHLVRFIARDTQRQPTQAYGVVALPAQIRATVRLTDVEVKAPGQGRSFVLRQGAMLATSSDALSAETTYPETTATAILGALRPGESRTVSTPLAGARQGSLALARRTNGNQRGLRVTADVTDDDTITLIITNTSPTTQDLGTTTWQVRVVQF